VQIVQTKYFKEVIELETGFRDSNLWLEWIQYTARSVAKEECYACATGWYEKECICENLRALANKLGSDQL
jgi:hypothetical protein